MYNSTRERRDDACYKSVVSVNIHQAHLLCAGSSVPFTAFYQQRTAGRRRNETLAQTRSPGTHSSSPAAAAALPTFELSSPLYACLTLVDNNMRFTSAILKDASNSTPLQHVDGRLYKLYIFRVTCAMSYNPGALFITVTKFLRLPQALRYCIIRRNRFNYYRRNIVFVSVSVSVFVSGLMQLYNKRAVQHFKISRLQQHRVCGGNV